jgi:hypothetical protein
MTMALNGPYGRSQKIELKSKIVGITQILSLLFLLLTEIKNLIVRIELE